MSGGFEDRRAPKRPREEEPVLKSEPGGKSESGTSGGVGAGAGPSSQAPRCRDFDKGTCFRGDRCKFSHPEGEEKNAKIPFCKDYKGGLCKFRDCVYMHGTPVLEDEYLKTGWVPRFVLRHCLERFSLCIQYLKEKKCSKGDSCKYGHSTLGLDLDLKDFDFSRDCNHELPVEVAVRTFGLCKEFIRDNCSKREEECKFRHRTPGQLGMGNSKTTWSQVWAREGPQGYVRGPPARGPGLLDREGPGDFLGPPRGLGHGPMMGGGDGSAPGNNIRAPGNMQDRGPDDMNGPSPQGFGRLDSESGMNGTETMLRRENESLRMEVEDLRKKNEGLKATNQFLLEENANMRIKAMAAEQIAKQAQQQQQQIEGGNTSNIPSSSFNSFSSSNNFPSSNNFSSSNGASGSFSSGSLSFNSGPPRSGTTGFSSFSGSNNHSNTLPPFSSNSSSGFSSNNGPGPSFSSSSKPGPAFSSTGGGPPFSGPSGSSLSGPPGGPFSGNSTPGFSGHSGGSGLAQRPGSSFFSKPGAPPSTGFNSGRDKRW